MPSDRIALPAHLPVREAEGGNRKVFFFLPMVHVEHFQPTACFITIDIFFNLFFSLNCLCWPAVVTGCWFRWYTGLFV